MILGLAAVTAIRFVLFRHPLSWLAGLSILALMLLTALGVILAVVLLHRGKK